MVTRRRKSTAIRRTPQRKTREHCQMGLLVLGVARLLGGSHQPDRRGWTRLGPKCRLPRRVDKLAMAVGARHHIPEHVVPYVAGRILLGRHRAAPAMSGCRGAMEQMSSLHNQPHAIIRSPSSKARTATARGPPDGRPRDHPFHRGLLAVFALLRQRGEEVGHRTEVEHPLGSECLERLPFMVGRSRRSKRGGGGSRE